MEAYDGRTCEHCGKPLPPHPGRGPKPRFCSHRCQQRRLPAGSNLGPCPRCGEAIIYKGVGARPKFCGRRCAVIDGQAKYKQRIKDGAYGTCSIDGCPDLAAGRHGLCPLHYERNKRTGTIDPLPRGAKSQRKVGDRIPTKSGYVLVVVGDNKGYKRPTQLEHRVVMERMLGRPLVKGENVHHINGRRDDNRPENLELWVKPQPAGQRPEDLVAWVVEHYPDLVKAAMT